MKTGTGREKDAGALQSHLHPDLRGATIGVETDMVVVEAVMVVDEAPGVEEAGTVAGGAAEVVADMESLHPDRMLVGRPKDTEEK